MIIKFIFALYLTSSLCLAAEVPGIDDFSVEKLEYLGPDDIEFDEEDNKKRRPSSNKDEKEQEKARHWKIKEMMNESP